MPRARYTRKGFRKMARTAAKFNWKLGRQKRDRGITMGWTTNNNKRLRRLERMIETKEGSVHTSVNVALPHNNILVLNNSTGAVFNPLYTAPGTGDPMAANSGSRIGDQITIKGLMIKMFVENALSRARVYYRFMLIKCAKGDTIDRSTLFKNDTGNKMLDQINTERYTLVANKTFTINCTNTAPTTVDAYGVPSAATPAGISSKMIKLWIPGTKFGRGGNLRYEDGQIQPKFFDYRLVFLAYDWYGTPQDTNNVGKINELYTKLYFKDA